MLLYFGTYTRSTSPGIYVAHFDPALGTLSSPRPVATLTDPTFLAIHPTQPILYAVCKTQDEDDQPAGGVAAFEIDAATGDLTPRGQASSGGPGPCYVSVTPDGHWLLVANYASGRVACIALDDQGRLGQTHAVQHQGQGHNPKRQEAPHAHSFVPVPTQAGRPTRHALAADLGTDEVVIYQLGEQADVAPLRVGAAKLHPGAGPRHIVFHPTGRIAYVVNELDATVTTFAWNPEDQTLQTLSTVPGLPENDPSDPWAADIHLHPQADLLYTSNRNHDSLALFTIAPGTHEPVPADEAIRFTPTGGNTPRNFAISPSGHHLLAAHQDSDNVTHFNLDPNTGQLTKTDTQVTVPMCVCLKFYVPH